MQSSRVVLIICATVVMVAGAGAMSYRIDSGPKPASEPVETPSATQGAFVENFKTKSKTSCEGSAKEAFEKKNGKQLDPSSEDKISSICGCMSNYMTKNLTADDISQSIAKGLAGNMPPTPHIQSLISQALSSCMIH